MSKNLPWYKRDVDAWRGGTRSMSIEMRGFYSECLDAMWDLQGAIPAEVEKLAIMLCCNPRTVRKLLPQLIALGKLIRTNDGYLNPRMADEIEAAGSGPIPREFDGNSNGIGAEFDAKVSKNPTNSTRGLEKEDGEVEEETPSVRAGRDQIRIEKGRVVIGEDLASEITAEFPNAVITEVATSAAAHLVGKNNSRDAMEAIVRKCAMWNHHDNLRRADSRRRQASSQPSALDVLRSMNL